MNNKKFAVFEQYPVPKAIATLALPCILSMIVNLVYNMADTFFVAQTGDANQVAAVSIATPIFLLLMAVGNIFGIGGSAFLSRSLGEKRFDRVKNISSFCFWLGIIAGVVMALFFFALMPFLLKWCGASANTYGYAKDYLSWIAWGAPFVVLSVVLSNLVRGEGSAKTAMSGMMFGTIVNIVLDPIMILGMNMGVAGAAIATIIGNACSALFFFIYILWGKRSMMSLKLADFTMRNGIFKNVVSIGIPGSLNNVLMSVSAILMNNFLGSYGDEHIAAMGIASKANLIVVFILLGLGMGVQPLIGYTYGAKNYTRMKAVMKHTMLYSVIWGSVVTVIYFFFDEQIIRFFIDTPSIVESGVHILHALMLAMPVLGIMFVFSFSFQAIGKALPALILSLSRQGLVYVPMLFIGRAVAGLNGIVYAQPIADVVSLALAVSMFLSISKEFGTNENSAATAVSADE